MSETTRYLCFGLGNEEFALPLLSVKEVIGLPEVTPVPQTPTHFLGIMNLRGSVISIIDLRVKLGIKPSPSEEITVMILDLGDYNLGIVVDRVNSVLSLSSEDISSKPMIDSAKSSDYVAGVFRKNDHLILLLDVTKALSVEDRNALSKKNKNQAA